MMNPRKFTKLYHFTRVDSAIGILNSGKVDTLEDAAGNAPPGVEVAWLSPNTFTKSKYGGIGFVFDPSLVFTSDLTIYCFKGRYFLVPSAFPVPGWAERRGGGPIVYKPWAWDADRNNHFGSTSPIPLESCLSITLWSDEAAATKPEAHRDFARVVVYLLRQKPQLGRLVERQHYWWVPSKIVEWLWGGLVAASPSPQRASKPTVADALDAFADGLMQPATAMIRRIFADRDRAEAAIRKELCW